MNNNFKFSDGLYGIDDTRLKEIANTYIDNHKVIEKKAYGDGQYRGKGTFGFDSVDKGETRKLAFKVGKISFSFTDNLGDTSKIKTNRYKDEYNEPKIVLTYDDIEDVVEDYADDVKQLALLSNSANNSFKAITGKKVDVENMIFAENPITKVGTAAFLSVRAFSDEDHGMYLRSSNARYANADKNSSVSAVFREIIDEGFAKIAILNTTKLTKDVMREQIEKGEIIVDEYNQVSDVQGDKTLNPLRKLEQKKTVLEELHEGSNSYTIDKLNEWQEDGDIRGTTNFYTIDSLAYIKGKKRQRH